MIEFFIQKYQEPTIIEPHPSFKSPEKALVIVREGHGAIGIKDNWSIDQIKRGAITYRIGRFYKDETSALDADPLLAKLPRRE